jgi:3-methyl-2-oxobutanoate hydroxymethyltransferase
VTEKLTVPALQAMKRQGRKIAAAVAWDTATARVLDGAGVDLVSVGDSVAVVLWGRESEGDVTLDELLVPCAAVARGVERALVSCDLPDPSVEAAARLRDEGGAGLVKVEGLGAVRAVAAAGASVAEIADQLSLSQGTVRNYLSTAIQKVNAQNRVEAAHIAERNGWL